MSESSNKKALKSGIWYLIGNFILKGIGFLTTPFFTRLMTQEDIGDFSNILTWVGVLSIVFTFDLYSSVAIARFDYKEDMNSFIASNLLLGSGITLVFFGVLFPFRDQILSLIKIPQYVLYYSFAYMITYPAIQMFQAKSQIEYKYKASLAVSIFGALGSSVLSIVFVAIMQNQLYGRTVGYFIPFIAVGFGIYCYILLKARTISWKYCKYALKISFPLVFHLLSGYILSSSDRIMIRSLQGNKALGLYSVAYSGAMVVSILMTSLNSAWVPWSMAQIDENKANDLRKASRVFVTFFSILVLSIILLGPEILLIMGGKSYSEAMYVLPPVMVGFMFQFIYSLYVNIEQYYKKQKMVAVGTVIAAILNVLLNWWLIPIYGYIAAAYTTLFSYIILFIIHFAFVKFLKKYYFYDNRYNILILGCTLILLPIASMIYSHLITRMVIIGLITSAGLWMIIRNKAIICEMFQKKTLSPILLAFNKEHVNKKEVI